MSAKTKAAFSWGDPLSALPDERKPARKKVFLGGTCNGSTWRARLIPLLKTNFFDPVVDVWDEAAQERERTERERCDFCLYVITPKIRGMYAIAEVVEDAIKRPKKAIFCFLEEEDGLQFDAHQIKSLKAVGELVRRNEAMWLENLESVARYVNGHELIP